MSLWFKHEDIWVCAPPKCGGTALYCAALEIDPELGRAVFSTARSLTKFHAEPGSPAIMAVRDPIDRFCSLWRDKCRDGDDNLHITGLTPGELMDLIEHVPFGNSHWYPQVFWYRSHVELVPFRELLSHLGLPSITVNSTVQDKNDPPMPERRIRSHYRSDLVLCSRL